MSGTLLLSEILDKVHKAKTKTQKINILLKRMMHQQEQNIQF